MLEIKNLLGLKNVNNIYRNMDREGLINNAIMMVLLLLTMEQLSSKLVFLQEEVQKTSIL